MVPRGDGESTAHSHTVKSQKRAPLGRDEQIYFAEVWKGLGSNPSILYVELHLVFYEFVVVRKGCGQDKYIYRLCQSE